MTYPSNFEDKIGFTKIRELLAARCLSSLGRSFVERMKFSTHYELIERLTGQAEEMRQILLNNEHFPAQDYIDMTTELHRLSTAGSYIDTDNLINLKLSLQSIYAITKMLDKIQDIPPLLLLDLRNRVNIDYAIIDTINNLIDEKGEIRSSASPELNHIRQKIISNERAINNNIQKRLKQAKQEGWIEGDIEITLRNGRMVIPMPASNKRKIRGFVHDHSATGQTVYIEPEDVFETNNEIRELHYAERREIIHILTEFTDELRPQTEELLTGYHFLGMIDFIRAKALLALELNAAKPFIKNKCQIGWINAVHPLLYLSHKKQGKEIVPLTLELNTEKRILIISGPNAGGKSVCLKTTGLIQYMLQCGILVPMTSYSEAGIFQHIFIDIGDEQSLENDLSTYSSHLTNMKNFMHHGNNKTLVLIDEMGTGTEPQLGGPISEAVIEKLVHRGCFGVITTHYANLKIMSERFTNITNGAMLYDSKKMKPLYTLKTGKPGSSFAFEIAKKIGFPDDVLKAAAKKTGKSHLNFEYQLQQLEADKIMVKQKEQELQVADEFMSEMVEKYQKLHNELKEQKQQIIRQAQQEAKELLKQVNKKIEGTIRDIKEAQANKDQTRALRKKLNQYAENFIKEEKHTPLPKPPVQTAKTEKYKNTPLGLGDYVKTKNQEAIGEIIEMDHKQAIVSYGSFMMRSNTKDLIKVSATEARKVTRPATRKKSYSNIIDSLNDKAANFSLTIDVRGMRGDEALSALRQYIEDAILLSISEVNILHGKGNGILREVIREYLGGMKEITGFRDAHIEQGGAGITVVSLR